MGQPVFITCIGLSKPSFPELCFSNSYLKSSENSDISWEKKKVLIKTLEKAVLYLLERLFTMTAWNSYIEAKV